MSARLSILALAVIAATSLSAQEHIPDIGNTPVEATDSAIAPHPLPASYIDAGNYVPSCLLSDEEAAARIAFSTPSYSPVIAGWENGIVWAGGGSVSYPGKRHHRHHPAHRPCVCLRDGRSGQIRIFPRTVHTMDVRRLCTMAVCPPPGVDRFRQLLYPRIPSRHGPGSFGDALAELVRRIPVVGHRRTLWCRCGRVCAAKSDEQPLGSKAYRCPVLQGRQCKNQYRCGRNAV